MHDKAQGSAGMTQVTFYTGVPERLLYLCRLLRKAQRAGTRIAVCGPEALLARLDVRLWDFEAAEFVPHGRLDALGTAARHTPILLTEQIDRERITVRSGTCYKCLNCGASMGCS